MTLTKIIIADDHTLFTNGLELLLKQEPDMQVIGVVGDGKSLLSLIELQRPHLILLDINMPEMSGMVALQRIKQNYAAIKVLMLSTYNEAHLIETSKQFGANGYLLKNCSKPELLKTIAAVMQGNSCFPYRGPDMFNNADDPDHLLKQFNLTRREIEIVFLIKEGLTNQLIAEKLFLSIFTVATHRKNIMHKLHLKSPAALMRFLMESC